MKMIFAFCACILYFPIILISQDSDNNPRGNFHIEDIQISAGLQVLNSLHTSVSDFSQVLLNSPLYLEKQSEFDGTSFFRVNEINTRSVMLNYRPSNISGSPKNRILRVGLEYGHGARNAGFNVHNSDPVTVDTLVSIESGQIFTLDSVNNRFYGVSLHANNLNLEAAYLFTTNAEKESFGHIGLGVGTGFIYNAVTRIIYSEDKTLQPTYSPVSDYFEENGYGHKLWQERLPHKSGYNVSLSVPMGATISLIKRGNLKDRIKAMIEIKQGVQYTYIPQVASTSNYFIAFKAGLKIAFRCSDGEMPPMD